MSYWRIGLLLVLGAALPIDTLAQRETTGTSAQPIKQLKPQFPASEFSRGREGWVLLNYTVGDDGIVVDSSIDDSSGSDAFNNAALKAVRDWRFESTEEQELNVLLSFVYEWRRPLYDRKFIIYYTKAHEAIDNGDLDDAQERIDAIRDNDDLTPYELASSFIVEGRVAAERGNQAEQLRCFRRAMLNQGRWVARETYLKLLYAAAVLEIQQQDFASALRDYELLTETRTGRKIAVDLEEPIQAVRALVESDGNVAPPYMAANMEMSIERELRKSSLDEDTRMRSSQEGSYPSRPSTSEPSTRQ